MTGPRDWDKELDAVDKAIQRMKPEPTGRASTPTPSAFPRPTGGAVPAPAPVPKRAALATWLRVWLVLALAVAVPFWPYPRGCGMNLFLYLGVVSLLVLAGMWGASSSWQRRMGLAHVLSLLTVVWGLVLVGIEVLPRVGYAARALAWGCGV